MSAAYSFNQDERKGLRIESNWFHSWAYNESRKVNFNDIAITRKWFWPLEKVAWLGLELNVGLGISREARYNEYYPDTTNFGIEVYGAGPSIEFSPMFRINDRMSIYLRMAGKFYFGLGREFEEPLPGERIYWLNDLGSSTWFLGGFGFKFDLGAPLGNKYATERKHLFYKKVEVISPSLSSGRYNMLDFAYAFKFNEKWGIKGIYESIKGGARNYSSVTTDIDNWHAGIVALRNFNFEGKKPSIYFSLEANLGIVLGRKFTAIVDELNGETTVDIFDGVGPTLSLIPTFQFSNWGAIYFDFNAHCLFGDEFDFSTTPVSSFLGYRFGYSTGSVGFRLGL